METKTSPKKILAAITAFASFPVIAFCVIVLVFKFILTNAMGIDIFTMRPWIKSLTMAGCVAISSLLSFGIYRLIVGKDFDSINRNIVSRIFVGWLWGTGNSSPYKPKDNSAEGQDQLSE